MRRRFLSTGRETTTERRARWRSSRRELEARVLALEQVIAGAGAVLSSSPDPPVCATPEDRVAELEAVVTGAGAVLRSVA